MNTQCDFIIKCDSQEKVLECAHKTLLSFDTPKKGRGKDFIDFNTSTTFAIVKYMPDMGMDFYVLSGVCLITVKKISESNCNLTITVDSPMGSASNKGDLINFMAEFIKRFSADLFPSQ